MPRLFRGMFTPAVFLVAFLAVAAPIVAVLLIARYNSVASERARGRALATEIARRADITANQMRNAFDGLAASPARDPCSIQGTRQMAGTVLRFDQIQGAGFVENGRVICTSAGPLDRPIALPA